MGANHPSPQPKGDLISSSTATRISRTLGHMQAAKQAASAPRPPTAFQVKAIKALNGIKNKERKPKLHEWTPPKSNDPDVELMVIPLETFKGYMPGGAKLKGTPNNPEGSSEDEYSSESDNNSAESDNNSAESDSPEEDNRQPMPAASSSRTKVAQPQVKSGNRARTSSSKPHLAPSSKPHPTPSSSTSQLATVFKPELAKDKLPAWPGTYEDAQSATEGKDSASSSSFETESEESDEGVGGDQDSVKRQLWNMINSSTWPPKWDDLEAEVRVLDLQTILEDLTTFKTQAQLEQKPLVECCPDLLWPIRAIQTIQTTEKMYEGAASSGSSSKYKAKLMVAQAVKVFSKDVIPELERYAAARQAGMGGSESSRTGGIAGSGGSGGGQQGQSGSRTSNKGANRKKGKKK